MTEVNNEFRRSRGVKRRNAAKFMAGSDLVVGTCINLHMEGPPGKLVWQIYLHRACYGCVGGLC